MYSIFNSFLVLLPLPISINYHFNYGSLLAIALGSQIVLGIILSSYYLLLMPNNNYAYDSLEYIVRDLSHFILQSIHSNGAALFFILIYLHISKSNILPIIYSTSQTIRSRNRNLLSIYGSSLH